jgi:hypothetical protein
LPRARRSSVKREIALIRRSLTSMEKAFGRLAPLLQQGNGTRPQDGSAGGRRKPRLSPARRAALKQQGQYLGRLRGLKPRQRAQVKAMREKRGVRSAIALAKRLARS